VRKEKSAMMRFLRWQVIITVFMSISIGLVWGQLAAESVVFGGLLAIIPNIFFVLYFFTRTKMSACYIGEALKIILTALLLILVLHIFNVQLAPLLLGLLGTYVAYFFVGK